METNELTFQEVLDLFENKERNKADTIKSLMEKGLDQRSAVQIIIDFEKELKLKNRVPFKYFTYALVFVCVSYMYNFMIIPSILFVIVTVVMGFYELFVYFKKKIKK